MSNPMKNRQPKPMIEMQPELDRLRQAYVDGKIEINTLEYQVGQALQRTQEREEAYSLRPLAPGPGIQPVEMEIPQSAPRRVRFTAETVAQFANALREGKTVSDNEPVSHLSTAYQRAKTLAEKIRDHHGVFAEPVTWRDPTTTSDNPQYFWALRLTKLAR